MNDSLTPAAADMAARLRPTPWQITLAQALLWFAPLDSAMEHVAVPLALPGKTRGVWTVGQPVEVVNGFWPANRSEDDSPYAHRPARLAAEAAAVAALRGRPGTPAHALIDRQGTFQVFEGHDTEAEQS